MLQMKYAHLKLQFDFQCIAQESKIENPEKPRLILQVILNENNDMEKLDLKKIVLPLSEEKFKKLSRAIETGQIRWRDLSMDLTYAYQAFWRSEKYKNCE